MTGWLVVLWGAFVFSGRPGGRPLQGNLKFGRRGELRSPVFVCGFRLFSGGASPSPTGWSFVHDMRLFLWDVREVA